jgi:TP901 family phage tail tape measure protein
MASRSDIRAGRAYVELYLKNSALMKGLASIRQQAQAISDEFMKMGATLTKVGVAMSIPIALATKRFADFDDQMRTVKAVSQSSEAEFQKLTATAKNLGSTTSFTAVQVAEMMTELGRAGFTAGQIDVMTAAVLNLSRATGTEGAMAAGIMAASLRQFGLGADQAARVSDGLTAAANKSFNSVESLGEALSYVGPVAADMGMSIEETLAILGGLGNIGIQGSSAGTAFKRLLTITAAEADSLREIFGVAFVDAAGNARPLIDTLEEVNRATAGMGSAERASKFNQAFGLLGITAAGAIGKNSVSIKQLHEDIKKAGGVAADTAKQMDAGLGGSLRILLSAVEGVAIAIGEALAPVFQQIGEYIIPAIGIIQKFIEQNKALVQIAAGVVVGIIALGGAFLTIGASAGMIVFAINALLSIGGLIAGAFSIIATTLGLLMTPVIGLTALIVALGAVIVGIAAYWLFFTEQGRSALNAMMAYLKPFLDFVKAVGQGMIDAMMGGNFMLALQIAGQALMMVFRHATAYVIRLLFTIPHAVRAMYDSLPDWMKVKLITKAVHAGDNVLKGIETAASVSGDASTRKLIDLIADAKRQREALNQKPEAAGGPQPGTPEYYTAIPGAPAPEDLAKLKTIGSFSAAELTMQNWGVVPAPKVDKQAEQLKRLDDIYKANMAMGQKQDKTIEAIVNSNRAYEPMP